MFPCPHCGEPIEVETPRDVPWYKDENGRNVSLGCGTLVIIAIIVAVFSGDGDDSNEIRALGKQIQSLEEKIDELVER